MKNKYKALIGSTFVAVAALGMIVGETYALFTSSDNANITVSSGEVDVDLGTSSLKVYSASLTSTAVEGDTIAGTEEINEDDARWDTSGQTDYQATYYYERQTTEYSSEGYTGVYFSNAGYFASKGTDVVISNMSAGDRALFNITITNNSDIDIKWRAIFDVDTTKDYSSNPNGLADAYDLYDTIKNVATDYSSWTTWLASDTTPKTASFDFEMPILDNEHQGLLCYLTFSLEAVQANAYTTDSGKASLPASINNANEELEREKLIYPTQALEEIGEEKTTALLAETFTGNDHLVWFDEYNLFGVGSLNGTTGMTSVGTRVASTKENIWYFATSAEDYATLDAAGYATYINYTDDVVTLTTANSVDLGTTHKSLTYTNSSDDSKEVVLRTASFESCLTVNGKTGAEGIGDEVSHYGYAYLCDVKTVADASFHEYGTVGRLKITTGHVVAEPYCEVFCLMEINQGTTTIDTTVEPNAIVHEQIINLRDYNGKTSGQAGFTLEKESDGVANQFVRVCSSHNETNMTKLTKDYEYGYYVCKTCGYICKGDFSACVSDFIPRESTPANICHVAHLDDDDDPVYEGTFMNTNTGKIYTISNAKPAHTLLANAISEASSGDEIKVLSNFDLEYSVSITKDLKLNLNDFTITNKATACRLFNITGAYTFEVDGDGDGKMVIDEDNTGSYGFVHLGSAASTLNVHDIYFSGTTDYAAIIRGTGDGQTLVAKNVNTNLVLPQTAVTHGYGDNMGFSYLGGYYINVTIDSCTINNQCVSEDNCIIQLGYFSEATIKNTTITTNCGVICETTYTEVTFIDNNFTNADTTDQYTSTTICASVCGTATIDSGTYTAANCIDTAAYYEDDNHIIVNGGTFNGTINVIWCLGNGNETYLNDITVNDGTFSGGIKATSYGVVVINGGTFTNCSFSKDANSTIVITGGTFDADPTAYVDTTNYDVTQVGTNWVVTAKQVVA